MLCRRKHGDGREAWLEGKWEGWRECECKLERGTHPPHLRIFLHCSPCRVPLFLQEIRTHPHKSQQVRSLGALIKVVGRLLARP